MQELELQSLPVDALAGTEMRRWPRHKIDVRVRVTVQFSKAAATVDGWAHDLSRGGLAIFLPADLAIGKTIDIHLTLPNSDRRVRLRGTVRARRGFNYGIQFKVAEPRMWPSPKLARNPVWSGGLGQMKKRVS